MCFIITQNILKILNEEIDYDKLPKDDVSLVEMISIKSNDVLGSRISIETNIHIDMILKSPVPATDIFSFLDTESDDMDMSSDCTCASHDHYTTTKLHTSATTSDSAPTSDSAATTGSITADSGVV